MVVSLNGFAGVRGNVNFAHDLVLWLRMTPEAIPREVGRRHDDQQNGNPYKDPPFALTIVMKSRPRYT